MSTTTPTSPGAVSLVQPARRGKVFDWNKQWYPIVSLAHADPGRTHAVQLLGKDLVLWRDNEDRWTCFDDRCPHRAAPLTEGRVESDGSLLCAYHAWRFDADGKCLIIPQSDRGGKDEAQPKACAKVYPTQVVQGVIWIWGENGPDSALESAVTPAALTPDLLDEEGVKSGKVVDVGVSFTDIAYGWETFMENVVDASHVPASHHGIAGSRYDDVRPLHFQLDTEWPVTPTNGFRYKFFDAPTGTHNKCTFLPPNLVINENCDPDAGTIKLYLHATPTVPGWCRIVTRQVFVYPHPPKSKEAKEQAKENKRRGKKKTQFASTATITRILPTWVLHPLGNLFLYQDLVFLHHQVGPFLDEMLSQCKVVVTRDAVLCLVSALPASLLVRAEVVHDRGMQCFERFGAVGNPTNSSLATRTIASAAGIGLPPSPASRAQPTSSPASTALFIILAKSADQNRELRRS
ncbi:unnamed protein product [Scytosiphon promiscuus]